MHEIDTGSTRPIRCNPRKLSPKKIKIQQELVDKMLEDGQIEHSVSAWSAPTGLSPVERTHEKRRISATVHRRLA